MTFITILGYLLCFYLIYQYFLYPAFLSPLSKIPHAHFTSRFSSWWIKLHRYQANENRVSHSAHERLGPIVRLGDKEISINSADDVKNAYSDNFGKHEFYRAFQNYGVPNMFSTIDRKLHSDRKRMLASLYSKTTVYSSRDLYKISQELIRGRLLFIIEAATADQTPLNMLEYSLGISMDFVTAYLFGIQNSSNLLIDTDIRREWLDLHQNKTKYPFWFMGFPGLIWLLAKFSRQVTSQYVVSSSREVRDLCLQMLKKTEMSSQSSLASREDESTDWTKPVVYDQLLRKLRTSVEVAHPDPDYSSKTDLHLRNEIASELMDHIVAGTTTTGWTLVYIMHEVSQRPKLQALLRAELFTMKNPIKVTSLSSSTGNSNTEHLDHRDFPSPSDLDGLPLLEAIILESLRLHPAVPGPQPRVTPSGISGKPVSLSGYGDIPSDVRVSAQAYSLHRNADVFPDPEAWKPERWLRANPDERNKMEKWFWAFSSGGRMCVGKEFAMYQLKLIIASIYTNYKSMIVDDEGIEQLDAYSAGPKGNKLMLKFERA